MDKKNEILELSFKFALDIIQLSELLESSNKFVISNQILKSGTSIGANIREAQSSESKVDFIHKLKIAQKEAEETEYWLLLCNESKNHPDTKMLQENLIPIKKLLSAIISKSKMNLRKN